MSSKINTGIFFAIAALTLMVAGTLYGGITSANAQQSTNVGNFASTTQGNNVGTATAAIGVSSTATGGAGGSGGLLGGAGGPATSTASNTGAATVAISQSNTATTSQTIDKALLIGANIDKNNDCKCPAGAQTANVGNFATTTQGNNVGSATAAIGVSSSATGGAGGAGGLLGVGGAGGAANSAAGNSGSATVAISQSNSATTTQSITNAILAGINFR